MEMKQPEISVIVPVYKVEPYLRQCIDSILAQTFTDFELILVDDGSPDNCGAICDEYAARDSRIVVIHQENHGLSAARNAGLDIMRGQYVTFVDSDDLIHPSSLEKHYMNMSKYNADVTKSFPVLFEQTNNMMLSEQTTPETRVLSGREASFELYDPDGWFYTVWDKLYRASLFSNIRFPNGLNYEDEAVIYKLYYSSKKIVEIKDQLYYYRRNPSGIMRQNFSLKRYDRVRVFTERYQFFSERGETELASMAKQIADIYCAKYAITSRKLGIYDQVESQYRMSVGLALRNIKKNCSEQNYEWWLNDVHPLLLRTHLYWKKIKSILIHK